VVRLLIQRARETRSGGRLNRRMMGRHIFCLCAGRRRQRKRGCGMALYAIGDLHLHFETELKAPMQLYDRVWIDHEKHLKENCARLLKPGDVLVLVGDHSWGAKLERCGKDLDYICSLDPGPADGTATAGPEKPADSARETKNAPRSGAEEVRRSLEQLPRIVLIRGNHDMFWEVNKTRKLNELYAGKLFFLQNNYYPYGDCALVGTKGYCYEGLDDVDHADKLVRREAERLRVSFEAASADGFRRFVMFLHYPPTSALLWQRNSVFTKMAEQYGAEQVVYAHCHGDARFHDSIRGKKRGIRYSLVSGDCLRWTPQLILPDPE
jgi:predicted phosphohydrolase